MQNRNNLVREIWCKIVTFWCKIVTLADFKYTFNLPEDHLNTWREPLNMNGPPFWGTAVGIPRNSNIETKFLPDTSPRFQTLIRRGLLIINVYLPVQMTRNQIKNLLMLLMTFTW